jgi:chromosome partitioning protein
VRSTPGRGTFMRVIAVANQKGGVAKTTTALSVAASLARQGKRVLAVDLDPQGNLGMGLGLDEDQDGPSVFEVLCQRGVGIRDAAVPSRHKRLKTLHTIPAGPRLAQAEHELPGQVGFDEVLKLRLKAVADDYEVAVLDCPPSLGALTINAIGAADLVLSPVQCEYFSARGVVKLLDVIELVRERRNPGLRFRVVPTLFDRRNNISLAVLNELRKEFGHEVSEVIVGVDTRMREAQAHGIPICVYAPRSRSAKAYRTLAQELMNALAEEGTHAQAA